MLDAETGAIVGIFGIVDPSEELALEDTANTADLQFASFTQKEGSAAVWGSRLSVVFDGGGRVSYVIGRESTARAPRAPGETRNMSWNSRRSMHRIAMWVREASGRQERTRW